MKSNKLNKKLCIIFDTNMIINSIDFNNINEISGNLKRVYDSIKRTNLESVVELIIPDIVLEEEKKHYIDRYYESKKVLSNQKHRSFPGLIIDIDNSINIESFTTDKLISLRKVLLNKYSILTNMKMNKIAFNDILERALSKKPPFEGGRGKSDKGFKDAVLWENILKYREEQPNYSVVLLSSDKMFNTELEEEYSMKFNESIRIYSNVDDLNVFLTTVTEKVSSELLEEVQLSKRIKEYIKQSEQDVLFELKEWLEAGEAYGPGITIFDILTLDTINLMPSVYSTYEVEGDYYALVKIQASGLSNGNQVVFSAHLNLDILLKKNNTGIDLKLTGLTLSSNEY